MAYTNIDKSSLHFNTKLFTGNGASNAITGVGFQPDWVWSKSRNQVGHHLIYDAVRGVQKFIQSSTTNAEQTNANTLTSFDSDGMTFNSADNGNASGSNGVAWCWKANGSGSSNTDGSISSTVSANTTAGFSIVKWTGTGSAETIGHGTGQEIKFFIAKKTSASGDNWYAYHGSLGGTKYLHLNNTAAAGTASSPFNNTNPTSTTISAGTDLSNSSADYIAYCFAEKTGFSKFGSYVGANSNQFIYLGFKPAMVIIKNTSISENWSIYDNKRLGYNPAHNRLYPNLNNAEATETKIDFVSNGMMLRSAGDGHLTGGTNTFVYMAFAEAPLVGSNNVPCTAR